MRIRPRRTTRPSRAAGHGATPSSKAMRRASTAPAVRTPPARRATRVSFTTQPPTRRPPSPSTTAATRSGTRPPATPRSARNALSHEHSKAASTRRPPSSSVADAALEQLPIHDVDVPPADLDRLSVLEVREHAVDRDARRPDEARQIFLRQLDLIRPGCFGYVKQAFGDATRKIEEDQILDVSRASTHSLRE